MSSKLIEERPQSLDDLLKLENIEVVTTPSTLNLEDMTEDDEVYILNVPKTVDPMQLKGQTLQLGEKSKLKLGPDSYCAVSRESSESFTCVFRTRDDENPYKTVNIKPTASYAIRRKLPGPSKAKVEGTTNDSVPFPSNIKLRHPLFGIAFDDK